MKMKCRECQKERKIPERFVNFPLCKNCRKCESCGEIVTVSKLFYYQLWHKSSGRTINCVECLKCWNLDINSISRKEALNLKVYDLDLQENQGSFYDNRLDLLEKRVRELETENERLKKQNQFLLKQLEEVGQKEQVAQIIQKGGKHG